MFQKPTIYWARPITTYSRTHKKAIEKHQSGEETLTDAELKLHCELYPQCVQLEQAFHQWLTSQCLSVVDPGSEAVASAFDAWQEQPVTDYYENDNGELSSDVLHDLYLTAQKEKKERCKNPMPFFTDLAKNCQYIIFTCFDDNLRSDAAPAVPNRIGCGVVQEVNAWAHAKQKFEISFLSYRIEDDQVKIETSNVFWPSDEMDGDVLCDRHQVLTGDNTVKLTCLDYPQTKALLLLQGYKSRSSKYKK